NLATAQATARASASLPAMRGPISVVSDSVTFQAVSSARARSRRLAACSRARSGMRVSAATAASGTSRAAASRARRIAARLRRWEKPSLASPAGPLPCAWSRERRVRSALLQRIADLAQQQHFLARLRRRGRGFLFLLAATGQAVDALDQHEDGEGHDQE